MKHILNKNMNKKELWLNIANYHFDHLVPINLWDELVAKFGGENPFTKAFADKLSRKLNWEKNFALKAIWEYKKFVYMGVLSDFSVTPSKIIDQVWHEHLLFSSGYRKFCNEVLLCNFDHNPELVSIDSQTEAFQSQYFRTIKLYKIEFGLEPPPEIWGATKFKVNIKKIKNNNQKNQNISNYSDSYIGEGPLISMFPSAKSSVFEFGGGETGGGGGGGSWGNSDDDSPDGNSGDSSDSGSSCSSGCGGD